MKKPDLTERAYDIERQLRAEGVPALMIPGLLGAAFCASLTNLPPKDRRLALTMHLEIVESMREQVLGAPQAPDGPMKPFPEG